MYNSPKYSIQYAINNLSVDLAYRIAPNYTVEIVDIASKSPGKGAGTVVYNAFENSLKDLGMKSIFAFTRYKNEKAKRWYERMGFTSTLVPFYYHDEENYQAWLLTKII